MKRDIRADKRKRARHQRCSKHPNKIWFTSAVKATFRAGIDGKKHGHKLYPYRCTFCGFWHLTSDPEQGPETQKRTS